MRCVEMRCEGNLIIRHLRSAAVCGENKEEEGGGEGRRRRKKWGRHTKRALTCEITERVDLLTCSAPEECREDKRARRKDVKRNDTWNGASVDSTYHTTFS